MINALNLIELENDEEVDSRSKKVGNGRKIQNSFKRKQHNSSDMQAKSIEI